MALVQISFLGRVAKGREGYARARYLFAGDRVVEAAFFGFALAECLRPARLAVLGTGGSMWHTLLEIAGACGSDAAARARLAEACEEGRTQPADLEQPARLLAGRLGCEVRLGLIPYGRTQEEQMRILEAVADQVVEGEDVALDVTHGLRHLPMLGLLSALLLRAVRGARVRGVYYGALDMTEAGLTPVLELSGLLAVADWAQALARLEAGGDYGALARELAPVGLNAEVAEALSKAAFYEQVCRYGQAVNQLNRARSGLKRGLEGPARLFAGTLMRELDRVKAATPAWRQYLLARSAFERGDYLRAVTLLQEAVLAAFSQAGRPLRGWYRRAALAKAIREGAFGPPGLGEVFARLTSLRNALVHADQRVTDPELEQWLHDPERLRAAVGELFGLLEPVVKSTGRRAAFLVNPPANALRRGQL